MSRFRPILCSLGALFLVGCAHSINVEPDLGRLNGESTSRIPVKVAYHVPPEIANIEVTTAGGGGDNVRYNPYAAMSAGYQKMLSNVFQVVVPLGSMTELKGNTVDYVMVPAVLTNSGGSNFFTWPPENFTVDLTSAIRGGDGKILATPRVVGVGLATTSERLSDHGYAGRRAFEDALRKMELALREWATAPNVVSADKRPMPAQPAERLRQLQDLLDRKLISPQEFETKRKAILSEL